MDIADFKINAVYTNRQIVDAFACATQGGMRRSTKTNTLVLIAIHYNPLYDDRWENNILNYTGMGTKGDQTFEGNQNNTLKELYENKINITLHLFESYAKGEYIYDGIVELADKYYTSTEPDIEGDIRRVFKFPLRRISNIPLELPDIITIEGAAKCKTKEQKKYDDKKIEGMAKHYSNNNPTKSDAKITVYNRSQAIVDYTKRRAKGVCDLCNEPAPFNDKDGNPYLECHHVIRLADGGPDAIYNTVALCPNCHRKIHLLNHKSDKDKLIKKIKAYLNMIDDNKSLIAEFKELF